MLTSLADRLSPSASKTAPASPGWGFTLNILVTQEFPRPNKRRSVAASALKQSEARVDL